MCASYLVRVKNPQPFFGLEVELRIDDFEQYDNTLIVPHQFAPVLRREQNLTTMTAMRFSLLPAWSKEPKVKFATHNARLETIDEKPTWKSVFVRRHALVPMSAFIEPVYQGPYAGNMVAFNEQSGAVIFAAAVWDEWVNKTTGEVIPSFSIVTYQPLDFDASVGHDRSPVFLSLSAGKEWLENRGASASDLKRFLLAHRCAPELGASIHRPLKAGWKKRIAAPHTQTT